MKCPKCQHALSKVTVKETKAQVASCPSCTGLLIHDKDLMQLVPQKAHLWDFAKDGLLDARKTSHHCPRCQMVMFSGKIPKLGTTVEHCHGCKSIWLDKGELQEVVQKCLEPPKPSSVKEISVSEITGQKSPGGVPPQFEAVRDADEEFLWVGQPEYLPFMVSGLPLLLIGVLWGGFDLFMWKSMGKKAPQEARAFLFVHAFPFWIGVINMLRLHLIHPNTWYGVSNKRVFLRSGFFGTDFKSIDHDKVANLEVNVNPIDHLFSTGSIKLSTGETEVDSNGRVRQVLNRFLAIRDCYEVFRLLKRVVFDTKTDILYPNAYRPAENPGYKTKLKNVA